MIVEGDIVADADYIGRAATLTIRSIILDTGRVIDINETKIIVSSPQSCFPNGCKVEIVEPRNRKAYPRFTKEMENNKFDRVVRTLLDDLGAACVQLSNGFLYRQSWLRRAQLPVEFVEARKHIDELLEMVF